MQYQYCPKAINQILQDIYDSNFSFAGVTTVFGRGFQQILPTISKGARPQIIGACLYRSPIWQHVTISINMHLQNALLKNRNFAQWLLQVGNGSNFSDLSGSTIQLHSCINIAPSITFLINNIYNNIDNMVTHDNQYFQD